MPTLTTEAFIDGDYAKASKARSKLINPATEDAWCDVASCEVADVERAIESANRAFEQTWRDFAPAKRSAVLLNIAKHIRENLEELAQLEMKNIGKPISDARDEIGFGARIFEFYAGAIGTFGGQTLPIGGAIINYTIKQPMGVVGAIVPWNFPFPITCWKVAPALATGNCVVLKPAELSPMTALKLGEIVAKAGLPAGVLQVVPGSGRTIGEALVKHPLVRKVSFTGSTSVGSHIMQVAAGDIKRISLELGGKSPNIVFADADLEKAAEKGPMSVFGNTGQDCCARSRIFVERKAYDAFVDKFVAATKKLVIGDPASDKTQIGPVVSSNQRGSIEKFIAGAKGASRKFATGGERGSAGKGYYLQPSVVLGCETSDEIWREEVFGPVVCIRPFDTEEQMLKEVNESPYGLSASIWTNDLKRGLRVAKRVESGVVSINSHSSVHVEAPFGGFKKSGIGRDLGTAAMEGYTELKNVFVAE